MSFPNPPSTTRPWLRRYLLAIILGAPLVCAGAALPLSTANNRVLELDGNGSYVELPPNIFNDLEDGTVEGWVKWRRFGPYLRFFESGTARQTFIVSQGAEKGQMHFDIWFGGGQNALVSIAGALRTNEW